eukprot:5195005-Pleurochrysis_carterae.AAC.2
MFGSATHSARRVLLLLSSSLALPPALAPPSSDVVHHRLSPFTPSYLHSTLSAPAAPPLLSFHPNSSPPQPTVLRNLISALAASLLLLDFLPLSSLLHPVLPSFLPLLPRSFSISSSPSLPSCPPAPFSPAVSPSPRPSSFPCLLRGFDHHAAPRAPVYVDKEIFQTLKRVALQPFKEPRRVLPAALNLTKCESMQRSSRNEARRYA